MTKKAQAVGIRFSLLWLQILVFKNENLVNNAYHLKQSLANDKKTTW